MKNQKFNYSAFKDFHSEETLVGFAASFKEIFRDQSKSLKKFAVDNKFGYNNYSKKINEPGSLFQHGRSKSLVDVLEGEITGLPFYYGHYRYKDEHRFGKPSRDVGFMKLSFTVELPHLVIDSIVEYDEHGYSTLPIVFDKSQEIKLEGDFNKYFRVYSPDESEVHALTILAPNIMELLIKEKAFCDIEIIKNHIYFYWPASQLLYKNELKRRFDLAEKLVKKLKNKLVQSGLEPSKYGKGLRIKPAQKPILLNRKILLIPGSLFSGFYSILFASYLFRDLLATKQLLGFKLDQPKLYEDQYISSIVIIGALYILYSYVRLAKSMDLEAEINKRYDHSVDSVSKTIDEMDKKADQEIKKILNNSDRELSQARPTKPKS